MGGFNKILKSTFFVFFSFFALQVESASFKLDKTRVVFEKNDRRAEFRIYNDSDKLQSFRVNLTEMQMHEAGHLEMVDEYPLSAKEFLRIGPRIARDIPPKSFARIRLIKKSVREKGEFRSHVLVESLTSETVKQVSGVFVQPNIKYIIPVFIRNYSDEERASVALKNHFFDDADGKLKLTFLRKGLGSFSGNLVIKDEEGKELYRANQISIYPELNQRTFRTELKREQVSGTLSILMESLEEDVGLQYQTKI
ncbi:hypothetical protein [Pseudoalteromonas sp. OANN1]|uniref:hypothetical protein n=1 Tax=Pseudoalteromonas sp. OANN1 TaxID=2954497 RepID=UPI00209791B9|nr:hypothetical protein [Pseudoalteromonas sp. OANN1]MCO7197685.1 hypothetical protein [Pseudoalteromonas sp. OANN1]